MPRDQFQKYYQELNKEQKTAVDSIEGPVMVIAGPGTGKTQVLTLRIANILAKTDIPAEAILAVTFTEAGVVAMRKRLAEMIGSQAYEVTITTFHGFAHGIIQKYPEDFPRIIGSVNITEADQVRIMEEIIDPPASGAKEIKILRPFGDRFHYLHDILQAIQTLKREGVSVEEFEDIVAGEQKGFAPDEITRKTERIKLERQIEKNRELSLLYNEYQKKLEKEKLYDFDDMIMEVLKALMTNDELRMILQEQYQYVLVDEHQDTNNAQNRILELLMSYHDNPNLFIVGDEKQAIFRFQGASLENFLYFKNKFPGAKLITLTQSYRSSQTILDVAKTNLTTRAKHPNHPIQILETSTTDAELYIIESDIKKKISVGTEPSEIAVLYRMNRDAQPVARMLEKLGVPYHIESDLDILADYDIRKLVLIFETLNQFGDLEYLAPILYLDLWKLDPLEVHGFISDKKDFKKTFPEVYRKLASWKSVAHNKGLSELFDTVVRESGLLASLLGRPDSVEALEKLGVFLDYLRRALETHEAMTLEEFMNTLHRMREHRILLRGTLSGGSPGKVRLMTAHRAKGLEFEHVYIINCFDGHWGGRRNIEKLKVLGVAGPASDDDTNLFYVALTRAKKTITISYARLALDQREQLPSQLISDLKPELVERVDMKKREEEFKQHREILFSTVPKDTVGKPEKALVRELFLKRGFAVTHLNNYLTCPWKYFFVNLVRVPKAPEIPQMYGTAIHGALHDMFAKKKDKNYLIQQFEKYLADQPMPASSKDDYRERGVKALKGYYEAYAPTWKNPVLPEYAIKGVELALDIVLMGTLDKVELLNDHDIIVTDYKTGKVKSRNEIMGKTRAADASYYRQLVFYNLLLNRHKDGRYTMRAGVIDFVEPNEYGKYKREEFEITAHETRSMEQEVRRVADEILNLKFWNETCDEPDCDWCGLRGMMR